MFTEGDKTRAVIGGIIISILLVALSIYGIATYRKNTHLTVTETNWQLEVGLLQYQTVHHDGWAYPPNDAFNVTSDWRYRTSERYISGYETVSYSCTVNGKPSTCTKTEAVYSSRPVYDTWYEWDRNEWVNIPPLVTNGNNKETIEWPNITGYVYDAPDVIGNVRLGQNKSHFWIVGTSDSGKVYSIDMVENTWRGYYKGRKSKLTLGFFGNVIQVE